MRGFLRVLRAPLDDYLVALATCLHDFEARRVVVLVLSLLISWWVYVPVHELAHALGCMALGGEVSRLEIDAIYGAALLARVFPFVAEGSSYAGQLTGFDTKGSDLTYMVTDFLPFVLTIGVGIPLLRRAAREKARPPLACIMLGGSIPVAYAPFISLTGDYYEMGSILVSRFVSGWVPGFDVARWRSDDMIELVRKLFFTTHSGDLFDTAGVAASFVVGLILIALTYFSGRLCSKWLWRETG
jgi:hypothetical protein